MKSQVKISAYSFTISALIIIVLGACTYLSFSRNDTIALILVGSTLFVLLITSLWFCPISITANTTGINMNSLLHTRAIQMDKIKSVKEFSPTMGATRILGSGGFLGYWGKYKERDTGYYYAFYGRASDCFLITLKDGQKFVLGCNDHHAIIEYIKKQVG